jgi:cation:H+ antiporter
MILFIIAFILGIVILLKSADFFVDGASDLATRFGVSAIVIGFTVVAFGT